VTSMDGERRSNSDRCLNFREQAIAQACGLFAHFALEISLTRAQ
jgi:hypothetical protein